MQQLTKFIWYLEVIPKLGVSHVAYVFFYRLFIKSRRFKARFPVHKTKSPGVFFLDNSPECPQGYSDEWGRAVVADAEKLLNGELLYYSKHWKRNGNPPNWFLNPFNGISVQEVNKHWTEISDFDLKVGDIKNVWEASRFDWVSKLARAFVYTGEGQYLKLLNDWLENWIRVNPLNSGPNWRCGQEASLRVFSLLNAAYILRQHDVPTDLLIEVIQQHVSRIHANIRFAVAQQNNHATSEAAALYIAGNWLHGVTHEDRALSSHYAEKGRIMLEELAKSLFYEDGSFAQHSVTYHRVVLDTLNLVSFWTKTLALSPLSENFRQTALKAAKWLFSLTDYDSGDCPNLGANDGANILVNHSCDYRDFRPTLQLASGLYNDGTLFYESGPWNENLFWFGLSLESTPKPAYEGKVSRLYPSGYLVMAAPESWALLRFPNYKFRPGHNDVFHFDLWYRGQNILMDSGTYSYNPGSAYKGKPLKSVHGHNTVSFSGKEQMPALSRFLLAKWIKADETGTLVLDDKGHFKLWQGSYSDYRKNTHRRKVACEEGKYWKISDSVSGNDKNIVLGFNFSDDGWKLDHSTNTLYLSWGQICIKGCTGLGVEKHFISRYYQEITAVNRLVVQSTNNTTVETTITLK